MNKWLFWGLLALIGFGLWKLFDGKSTISRNKAARDSATPDQAPPDQAPPALILACAHCGLHLPREEAVQRDQRWYCSADHASAGPRT